MDSEPRHIGDVLRERNIELATDDPVVRGGFTQVPNFILKNAQLSFGAKVTYSMFLHYAWHNDSCFSGQERLAGDMGITQGRVSLFIKELQAAGLIRSYAPWPGQDQPLQDQVCRAERPQAAEEANILILAG